MSGWFPSRNRTRWIDQKPSCKKTAAKDFAFDDSLVSDGRFTSHNAAPIQIMAGLSYASLPPQLQVLHRLRPSGLVSGRNALLVERLDACIERLEELAGNLKIPGPSLSVWQHILQESRRLDLPDLGGLARLQGIEIGLNSNAHGNIWIGQERKPEKKVGQSVYMQAKRGKRGLTGDSVPNRPHGLAWPAQT
jgi:hypothetical protein